jgi:hypothetical protein
MMITFTAMRRPIAVKTIIIGLLALLLSACSAVRLGYDNGPSLALWWLDGYLDLDRSQEARAKPLLEAWFAWHRATQLPDYAQWLGTWKGRAGGNVTGDEVCRWADLTRERLVTAVERAVPAGAELLPIIEAPQWQYLQKRFTDRAAEQRKDFLQGSRDDRIGASLDRAISRSEEFYGPLSAAQKKLLAERVAASPMEAEVWLAEREARQRELVQSLRRIQQEPDLARRTAALRAAAQRFMRAPDGDYGARQARWQQHGCELSAALHNSTTAQQRQHLRERLAGYEEDLRALAAAGGL